MSPMTCHRRPHALIQLLSIERAAHPSSQQTRRRVAQIQLMMGGVDGVGTTVAATAVVRMAETPTTTNGTNDTELYHGFCHEGITA